MTDTNECDTTDDHDDRLNCFKLVKPFRNIGIICGILVGYMILLVYKHVEHV